MNNEENLTVYEQVPGESLQFNEASLEEVADE